MANVSNLGVAGLLFDVIDHCDEVEVRHLSEAEIPKLFAFSHWVDMGVLVRVLVSSKVPKPDVIPIGSCDEGWGSFNSVDNPTVG